MGLSDYLNFLRTPGYRRAVVLRRSAAAVLVACAALSALLSRADADPGVVVFVRDVAPGDVVETDDLEVRALPEEFVPSSTVETVDDAAGQIVASHASAGEVVTATRLIGPDLVGALVGDNASKFTMVPVKLADPDVIPMLHHGDRVSVVTAGDGQPRTVADSGIVVTAGSTEEEDSSGVLLLLAHDDASEVAAASLTSPLAVVVNVANSG